jgi:hypothetical protein
MTALIEQQDRPMSLKHAAELFGINVATLFAERDKGRLATYKIGRTYMTTVNDMMAMVEACRVTVSRPDFTVTRRATNTSSATAVASLDSAQQALAKLRSTSRLTLPQSIARNPPRVR